uniref:Sphingosine kinase B n=1 Tax=Lygus hesperus TaxID=30085 RepID=A0A0A9WTY0_LYGHE
MSSFLHKPNKAMYSTSRVKSSTTNINAKRTFSASAKDNYTSKFHNDSSYCSVDPNKLREYSDSQLLGEDEIDFDDDSLPWVTIEGEFYNLLLCNVKDVARDVLLAPISHLSDGAFDIVFSRKDPQTGAGSRKEFLQFFLSLEKGKHVDFEFTNYVKARAAEIKVDHGISMSDGEMMPLSTVRVTKLRQAVRFVRS